MDTDKLIKEIKQLFYFHKQATTLESEYTEEIYDYLVKSGKMPLTSEQKLSIFAETKIDYLRDRESELKSNDKQEVVRAGELMRKLKDNKLPDEENKKLGQMCKIKSIKKFFDSIDNLII